MNYKNEIITGKNVREFMAKLSISPVQLQALLGLYSPTITKLLSPEMQDKPIDRLFAGMIRFYSNNPELLHTLPGRVFWGSSTLGDLEAACERVPICIGGEKLNAHKNAHLGIIIFRGYGAARKFLNVDSELTLQIVLWINIVCHCLSVYRADLIEQVILEEVHVHKMDLNILLKKAWPSITKTLIR